MTDRSTQNAEYVFVRGDNKPQRTTRYYYDADDDDEYSQAGTTTRRIVRTKPMPEQRIRYVMADDVESDYRRPRQAESNDVCIILLDRWRRTKIELYFTLAWDQNTSYIGW